MTGGHTMRTPKKSVLKDLLKQAKKKMNQPVRCPYCGSIAHIRPAAEIYHDAQRTDELYVCSKYPICKSYVSIYGQILGQAGDRHYGAKRR